MVRPVADARNELICAAGRGWRSVPCRPVPGQRCAGVDGALCGIHVVDAIADASQTEDMTARRIVFLIFDGLQLLDLVGPHEVFSQAVVLSPDAGYVCQVVARAAGPVRAASGLLVHAGYSLADLDPAGVDTVVAVGGAGVDLARRDRALVEWLAEAGRTARRVTSVCSGVFLLAAAGLVEARGSPATGAAAPSLPPSILR